MLRHLALCDATVELTSMQLQLQHGGDLPVTADTEMLDRQARRRCPAAPAVFASRCRSPCPSLPCRWLTQLIADGLVAVHNSRRIKMLLPRPVVARHDPVVARQLGW
jgi:hypothetical protein